VNQFLEDLDPIPLDEQAELGQEHFFDTFRLEEGSPFADLVTGMMDLLEELRDEREAKFVKGLTTFGRRPTRVSRTRCRIRGSRSSTGTSRCGTLCSVWSPVTPSSRAFFGESHGRPRLLRGNGLRWDGRLLPGFCGFGQSINLDAFPVAADNLIDDMQEQLVEGLFQDDIFVWWTDGYEEQLSRGHETGPNQFEAVARESGGWSGLVKPPAIASVAPSPRSSSTSSGSTSAT